MNHYERLGVKPTATDADVRRAYRQAARATHPDRHGERSAGQMAEVNEAWRVLGDRDRRRDYDAEIAAAGEPAATWSSPSASADAATPGSASPAALVYEPARFPWRFMVAMATAGIAVVIVGHLLTDQQPPPAPDGILRSGDCVSLSVTFEAYEVSCSLEHDAVVAALIPIDQVCPSGTEAFRDRQGLGTACVVRSGRADP